MVDWARNMAREALAFERQMQQKQDRAAVLRSLAASEGPVLWSQLLGALREAADAFNGEYGSRLIEVDHESDGAMCFMTAGGGSRRIRLTPHYDANGYSFLEYDLVELDKRPTHTSRVDFTLDDNDALSFAMRRQDGDVLPKTVEEVAETLFAELLPPIRPKSQEAVP